MKIDPGYRIAFRIDAGAKTGCGHLMRMKALADAFTERGHVCAFFRGEDEPVDYAPYNAVILDTYQVDDAYIEALRSPRRLTVCVDDNALYTYSCDVLLNANFHGPELDFRFGAKKPRLLLGPTYALLRREFRELPPFSVREYASRVFVCLGGSDVRGFTPRAVAALQAIPGVKLEAVLGPMTDCDNEVRRVAGANVTIHKAPDNLPAIMGRCDVAVTAAGSMVYELAAMGLPTIVSVQADNQEKIADYLRRHHLMTVMGDYTMLDLLPLRTACKALLADADRRRRESNQLQLVVARDGAARIVNVIEEMLSP